VDPEALIDEVRRIAEDPTSGPDQWLRGMAMLGLAAMEQLNACGRDGAALEPVFIAWVKHEISKEDFDALYGAVWDGIFQPQMLERRKLLALARQALATRP
jgi:hypothetical protein